MNLHFLIDNQYSRRFVLYMNERYGIHCNKFYVINRERELKFLNGIDNVSVIQGKSIKAIFNVRHIIRKSNSNCIFIHYLSDIHLFPLFFKTKKQTTYWIAWGGDYYSYIDFPLYDEITRGIVQEKKKKSLLFLLKIKFRNFVIKNKVNCIGISEYEYSFISNFYKINPRRINFKYPNPLNNQLNRNILCKDKDKIILVGNSGSAENNHIDVFYKLRKLTGDFKIITPLSYAYKENYRKIVIDKGYELFGDKFVPLIDFMNPEQYSELLSRTDVAIFNHFRQQAVGNCRTLIELGKKIYLNDINPVYKIFLKNGVELSLMPKGDFDQSIFEEYSELKKQENIKGLNSFYSDEIIAKYLDALFLEK